MNNPLRLGLNIDHVATVRNARGGTHPDPVRAALLGQEAGADGITAHLREDRRHIRDEDITRLKEQLNIPLNFEMAATDEMLQIALNAQPHACCLVPEKREELTTEGGLDVAGQVARLTPFVARLKDAGIRVSLFIEADGKQVDAAATLGADIVEFHTGTYVHAYYDGGDAAGEYHRLVMASRYAAEHGIEVHAGHGLTYDTVGKVAAIDQMQELNIGHFLIGEAMYVGLADAVVTMRELMNNARSAG